MPILAAILSAELSLGPTTGLAGQPHSMAAAWKVFLSRECSFREMQHKWFPEVHTRLYIAITVPAEYGSGKVVHPSFQWTPPGIKVEDTNGQAVHLQWNSV